MANPEANPLLSTNNASDSTPLVQLHPLVLLTISDYATRHTLRQQEGPIVGAIIGQQNGREITLEHAFECKLVTSAEGDVAVDREWFVDRLQQFKDVHKAPHLDFAAWFTLTPPSGPQPHHLPLQYFFSGYAESALLLAFHPSSILDGSMIGGKLPLTIYERVDVEGIGMQYGETPKIANLDFIKFRELPYSVETGEAEMIGIDFVAKGGGNATVTQTQTARKGDGKEVGKGKAKEGDAQVNGREEDYLSREEEELISSLTAKANAIKMLHARLTLIKSYLSSLPPSYLSDPSLTVTPQQHPAANPSQSQQPQLNHTLLRSISALLARLPLLVPSSTSSSTICSSANNTSNTAPPPKATFTQEQTAQSTDVALTSLLSSLTSSLRDAQWLGHTFSIVESGKSNKPKGGLGPHMGGGHGGGGQGGFLSGLGVDEGEGFGGMEWGLGTRGGGGAAKGGGLSFAEGFGGGRKMFDEGLGM